MDLGSALHEPTPRPERDASNWAVRADVGPVYVVRKYAGIAYGRRIMGVPDDKPGFMEGSEGRETDRGRYGVGRRMGCIVIRVSVKCSDRWQCMSGLG